MITPTICQVAVGMTATSLLLQLASAVARSSRPTEEASPDPVVVTPVPAPKPKPMPTPTLVRLDGKPVHPLPSLKLSAIELRTHARALGVKNARWRNSAKKVDLVTAIRQHYAQQEVSRGKA